VLEKATFHLILYWQSKQELRILFGQLVHERKVGSVMESMGTGVFFDQDKHRRRSIRLRDYDYGQEGAYFCYYLRA
jgi:hypothetical protein